MKSTGIRLLLTAVVLVATRAPAYASTPIPDVARAAIARYHLKSLIVEVRSGNDVVFRRAYGDSMSGVPATPEMHFRNGAMAFTYLGFMLAKLVDEHKVRLDEKLSTFFPDLPNADRITIKNLANMTAGYADYVYQPEVITGTYLNPFRHWTSAELVRIGVSKPMQFEPGTNWGYSHTDYVILGQVLERVTGLPLAAALKKYVMAPMDLQQTFSFDTPQVPAPVLHSYSSERRVELHIPAGTPFYEESTFWDPSWTTANGAVQVTDIDDMARSMQVVGSGSMLSKDAYAAEVGPNLAGFGHADPKCSACRANSINANYGLGVVNFGPWITQTKSFAGSGGSVGYLPSKQLTIAVCTTYDAEAFDAEGNHANASDQIFRSLAESLAPGTLPPVK